MGNGGQIGPRIARTGSSDDCEGFLGLGTRGRGWRGRSLLGALGNGLHRRYLFLSNLGQALRDSNTVKSKPQTKNFIKTPGSNTLL